MVINIHGGLITLGGCVCFNYSYFNGKNCSQFSTTINQLPTIDRLRSPMSCLFGTLILSLTGQSVMITITVLLVQAIWLFIVRTSLIHSIEDRQLPLLIPDFILKHRNIRLPPPMPTISSSPWIVVSSWLGGLLLSIFVSARLKDVVLVTITYCIPLIWVIVAVFRGKCNTLVISDIVCAFFRNT